jgi:hypothetical protein
VRHFLRFGNHSRKNCYYLKRDNPGLPTVAGSAHSLTIKTNYIFCLLRNFSLDLALVKNARVVVIDVGVRIVTVCLLRGMSGVSGTYVDSEDIFIPRIAFTTVLSSGHTLLQRQFLLAPVYSTTFNSCQGLTLDVIGVDLC